MQYSYYIGLNLWPSSNYAWLQRNQIDSILENSQLDILEIITHRGQNGIIVEALIDYFSEENYLEGKIEEEIYWNVVGCLQGEKCMALLQVMRQYACIIDNLQVFRILSDTHDDVDYHSLLVSACKYGSNEIFDHIKLKYDLSNIDLNRNTDNLMKLSLLSGSIHCYNELHKFGGKTPDDALYFALMSDNIELRNHVKDTDVNPHQLLNLPNASIRWLIENGRGDLIEEYALQIILIHIIKSYENNDLDFEFISLMFKRFHVDIEGESPFIIPEELQSLDKGIKKMRIDEETTPFEIAITCPDIVQQVLLDKTICKLNYIKPRIKDRSMLELLFHKIEMDSKFVKVISNILKNANKKEMVSPINSSTQNTWLHELVRHTYFTENMIDENQERLYGRMGYNDKLNLQQSQIATRNKMECAPICYQLIVKCLERGVKINAKDKLGRTPLHIAGAAPELLTADVSFAEFKNNLGLHEKSPNVKYLIETVNRLSEHGAMQIKDKEGHYPVDYCRKVVQILPENELLLQHIQDVRKKRHRGFLMSYH
eukprot:TRINITY_DN1562_c0_g1_i2.p1 TRINITY_DN1562_c0_g1~~TRINITY_DN1562_c0_g1_i2.p1  ORF type:complete len:542 (-),score=106.35 TRINITY_DN1562_c0_g1_i2:29-1654(-)